MNKKNHGPYRLIALVAGIVFFAAGIVMVFMGISAEGSIDIQGLIVSGKIKTGSAGLFVLLFSFLIIIVAISREGIRLPKPITSALSNDSSYRRAITVFLLLLGMTVLCGLGAILSSGDIRFGLATAGFAFGFMTFIFMFFLIETIERSR